MFNLTDGYTPRPVSYTHSFNAKRVFACILFCSYPCFSFSFDACLGCHQLSAAETHTENLATHGTHGGDPFVNFKLYSFNVKCSQKLVNLGTPFSIHNSDPKVIDVLFFLQVSAGILFLPFPWMFIWAAISYQLQEYIHRIWMNMVHLSVQ